MSSSSGALEASFARILDLVAGARTIAISGHTSPDGDSLGSALGLGAALRRANPERAISVLLADDAPVPRVYRFLPGADELTPASGYPLAPDLFISVDCPVLDRLAESATVARRARATVSIDHHPSRAEFADVSVRCTDAAATAVLIEMLLRAGGIEISAAVGTCLLCGIVTDTGRFQYQNANAQAFFSASRLVAAGAEPARIALEVYQSQRIEYLHLESLVMGRIKTIARGRVACSYARVSDLRRCGVSPDECDGLIDVVRSVAGVEVCLFLREVRAASEIRGNLRSKGDLDVSEVAAAFGGGGHKAAAGFTYRGTINAALRELLPCLAALVGEDDPGAGIADAGASMRR